MKIMHQPWLCWLSLFFANIPTDIQVTFKHQTHSMTLTTDQPDSADESLRATYSGAKRRIAALEQQLEDLRNAGSKHKSYRTIPRSIAR